MIEHFGLALFDDGTLVRSPDDVPALVVAENALGCSADEKTMPRLERSQVSARDMPSLLAISYYDPARDYQTSKAQAATGAHGGRTEAVELPAVLAADQAKGLAETSLARRWADRQRGPDRRPRAVAHRHHRDRLRKDIR